MIGMEEGTYLTPLGPVGLGPVGAVGLGPLGADGLGPRV